MSTHFDRDDEERLRAAFARGRAVRCPRCDQALDVIRIDPRSDVSYVRFRRWLRCASCGGSLVVDVSPESPE